MRTRYLGAFWGAIVILMFCAGIPFIWHFKSADLNKYSQYGTFVSALIGGVTLILVLYAYAATREQVRLAQKQAFDSIYFNFIESHRGIVDRLQKGKENVLIQECNNVAGKILERLQEEVKSDSKGNYRQRLLDLREETSEYLKTIQGKDVFDILYFILDKEYKLAGIM